MMLVSFIPIGTIDALFAIVEMNHLVTSFGGFISIELPFITSLVPDGAIKMTRGRSSRADEAIPIIFRTACIETFLAFGYPVCAFLLCGQVLMRFEKCLAT
jgi:hypothetical protein